MVSEDLLLAEAASRVLEAANDDWLYLLDVQGILVDVAEESGLELWWPNDGRDLKPGTAHQDVWLEERIRLGMRLVTMLLAENRLIPGYLSGGFMPWDGTIGQWLERIEAGWRKYGSKLGLGDVCWFSLVDPRASPPIWARSL